MQITTKGVKLKGIVKHSHNPSLQCSVCGQWKRLHGKDENGAVQRFYSCCGKNGEFEHLEQVCDECCKEKCPYRTKVTNHLSEK